MKKYIFALILSFAGMAYAQTEVREKLPQFSQDPNATYRLFPTSNMYTYILLDTRYGLMQIVQWNTDEDYRFSYSLNADTLAVTTNDVAEPGRFTIYATTNIYNFLLLDTKDGKVWQVQWSTDSKKRLVVPIYTEGELFFRTIMGNDKK